MAFKLRNPFSAKTADTASPERMTAEETNDPGGREHGARTSVQDFEKNTESSVAAPVAAADIDGDGAAVGRVALGGDGDGLDVDGARKSGSVIMQDRVADSDVDGEGVPDGMATMVIKTKTKSNQSNDRLGQEDGATGAAGAVSSDSSAEGKVVLGGVKTSEESFRVADGDVDGEAVPDEMAPAILKNKTKSNQSNDRLGEEDGPTGAAGDVNSDGSAGVVQHNQSDLEFRSAAGDIYARYDDVPGGNLDPDASATDRTVTKTSSNIQNNRMEGAGEPSADGGGAASSSELGKTKYNEKTNESSRESAPGPADDDSSEVVLGQGAAERATGPVRIDNTPARMSTNREATGASDAGTAGGEPAGIAIGDPGVNGNLAPSGDGGGIAIDHEGVQRTGAHEAVHTVQQDAGASREMGEQKKWLPANFREQSTAEDDEGPSTLLDLSSVSDGDGAVAIRDLDSDGVPAVGVESFDQDADGDAVDLDDMIADS